MVLFIETNAGGGMLLHVVVVVLMLLAVVSEKSMLMMMRGLICMMAVAVAVFPCCSFSYLAGRGGR